MRFEFEASRAEVAGEVVKVVRRGMEGWGSGGGVGGEMAPRWCLKAVEDKGEVCRGIYWSSWYITRMQRGGEKERRH